MYAIRSYYEIHPALFDLIKDSEIQSFMLAPIIVITSYSIHYTKLYENLSMLWVIIFTFVNAVFNSIQIPAYHASVTNWGSTLGLRKSNGLIQFGQAAADILTPLIAGWIFIKAGIKFIFVLDGSSFLFAVLMIVLFTPKEPWKTLV